jgi:hypothetical protein
MKGKLRRMATEQSPSDMDGLVVILFRVLFHDVFCPEEAVPDDWKPFVHPGYLLDWFDRKQGTLDKAGICNKAGVGSGAWDFARTLIARGTALQAVTPGTSGRRSRCINAMRAP